MSSVTGERIKLSLFGESHGEAIGCVIDGLPAGKKLDFEKIYKDMARRAPGADSTSSFRAEKDIPRIISGVLNGETTGAPLAVIIENKDAQSADYENIAFVPRPSHSDYTAYVKFGGKSDFRGGGHFSGRLTAPLVFAGAVAKQILASEGVRVGAHIKRIGSAVDSSFELNSISSELIDDLTSKSFSVINPSAEDKMRAEIERYKAEGDSVGGEIECAAIGVPEGLGGSIFDTVESRLSSILFAVPAVKGVQFGLGFGFAQSCASSVNDEYEIKNGAVALLSNNNGGVLGGITSGAPIVLSVAVKPTPSIAKKQNSVNLETMENETLEIKGRHDPCIVPRAVPVIEAAVAIGLLEYFI